MSGPHVLIFTGAVLAAIGGIWAAHQQDAFEKELRAKNEQTITSIQETLNMVTGGDSFAYLDFQFQDANTVSPMVVSQGKYPLYDVAARVMDMDRWNALTKDRRMTTDELFQANYTLDIGNLNPSITVMRNDVRWELPADKDDKIYQVTVNARNGWFEQTYNLRRVDGHWRRAYRVIEMLPNNGRVLREWAEELYPRNAQGEIEWLE